MPSPRRQLQQPVDQRRARWQIRETVEAVQKIIMNSPEGYASVSEIARRLRLDPSAALRRVHDCLKRDYLRSESEKQRGRKMRLKIGEPLPNNQEIFPTVASIVAHMAKSRKEGD